MPLLALPMTYFVLVHSSVESFLEPKIMIEQVLCTVHTKKQAFSAIYVI